MINDIKTKIKALSTFPDRPNYSSATAYSKDVAIWLQENKELSEDLILLIPELNTMIKEINSATSFINLSKAIIKTVVNYKGDYISGVYGKNDSVTIDGIIYISKIDNNTDTPPSVNWLEKKKDSSSYATYLKFS